MKYLWKILPIVLTLLPILLFTGFIAYYNSPNSTIGDVSNWPTPGSSIYWVQYILVALTSLAAVVFNIIGIVKNSIVFKIIFSVLLLISSFSLFISVSWIISPTPY